MRLYTKKDIEDIFKISRATVYRWCRKGVSPNHLIVKKEVDNIGLEDIERFINNFDVFRN